MPQQSIRHRIAEALLELAIDPKVKLANKQRALEKAADLIGKKKDDEPKKTKHKKRDVLGLRST